MENVALRYLTSVPILCIALALAACDRPQKLDADAPHYEARGIVRGFSPDRTIINIEHEAIPGFMPSMTMPLSARDSKKIAHLRTGDAISFQIEVTEKDLWIANVTKIVSEDVHLPKTIPTTPQGTAVSERLREGDAMSGFQLTDEAGERINLDTFRGRPWILTFIFTRCPMPNFCPRMAKNFAELQAAIQNGSGAVAQTRLLSITIDPQYDTPAVLKEYAHHEGADPKIWMFGTGDLATIEALARSFAVYTEREGGSITHSLTTALIDGNGKIAKLWRGDGWKPRDVIESLSVNGGEERR
jgi:protein SCO1/2